MSALRARPVGIEAPGAFRQQVRLYAKKPLNLEAGARLGPIHLSYETYGTLNAAKDNAVLVTHALTGDAHVARHHEADQPGWWDGIVGPGQPLDTERHFVICSNVLGGCQGSTGPDALAPDGAPYGDRFPVLTIRDMVRAQAALVEALGVRRLRAVVGGSMGGMQALEWALMYPDRVSGAIVIGADDRMSAIGIAYNEVQRQAIVSGGSDPQARANGLKQARMLAMITYRSPISMAQQFGRQIRSGRALFAPAATWRFEVESYLHHQGEALVARFTPDSYMTLTRAMDLHDIYRGRGDEQQVLRDIQPKLLCVGLSSDILFYAHDVRAFAQRAQAAGVAASYVEIDSEFGHDAFLAQPELLWPSMEQFLSSL